MDKIDALIDALNENVPEVAWVRDALETDTPESWGAVELTGGDTFDADGHAIDTFYQVSVWMCATDRSTDFLEDVNSVLIAFQDEYWAKWSLPQRSYLYDIEKAAWRWNVHIPGPLALPDEDEDDTEEADDTEDTEEEADG